LAPVATLVSIHHLRSRAVSV